jgi:hypothetical protein
MIELGLWHVFESENPATFLGMYQFWIQEKLQPASHQLEHFQEKHAPGGLIGGGIRFSVRKCDNARKPERFLLLPNVKPPQRFNRKSKLPSASLFAKLRKLTGGGRYAR